MSNTDEGSVELRPAFEWTCPNCGTDHFAREIRIEPEATEELGLIAGEIPDGFSGDWFRAPDRVTCPNCRTDWRAEEL